MAEAPQERYKLLKARQTLYEVLELPKRAKSEEIRKAYRKLALKYHPDKNPEDPNVAERFKEINAAHAILADPDQRQIYNMYGTMGLYVANRYGSDSAKMYFIVTKWWFKCLVLLCALLSCCCCCCCFCCGMNLPPEYEHFKCKSDLQTQHPDTDMQKQPPRTGEAKGADPVNVSSAAQSTVHTEEGDSNPSSDLNPAPVSTMNAISIDKLWPFPYENSFHDLHSITKYS